MAKVKGSIEKGLRIVPESSTGVSEKGDLEVLDSSGKLNYHNGTTASPVTTEAHAATLTNKSIDADNNTITNIDNADIKASAAIDRSKLASGSNDHVIINNGSGVLSSEAQLAASRGGTGISSTATFPASGVIVTEAATQTLTGKTIDGDDNTVQDLPLTAIKTVLADASKFLARDASGIPVSTKVVPTGAVVGDSDSQTLTNKTIDGDDNTVQDLPLTALKTNLTDASKFIVRDASGIPVSNTKAVPSGDVLGTSDAQVVTNKDIDGGTAANTRRITIPKDTKANLDALTRKEATLVYASDEDKLYVDDGANLQEIGSGSSSGINYIDNPDAETDTSGWATYADAAGSRPVNGTGGSPTFTWTRSTTTPLRGVADFLATKDAANRQGEGVSYDFIIDSADQARVQRVEFDYEIISGTYSGGSSSTDSDLILYLYDVTNSQLIEPDNFKISGAVAGQKYHHIASFQTNSNSTSYRLILHVASTSASAYVLAFDNFSVGPSNLAVGVPASDWVSYTPTGSFNTNTTYSGKWRRVGDSMELHCQLAFSGAPNSAGLTINLPSGYSIDTGKLTSEPLIGSAFASDSGVGLYDGLVLVSSATAIRIFGDDGTGQWSETVPFTMGASDAISIMVTVPILGWAANSVMSSDASGSVVSARYKNSGGTINTSMTIFDYDTKDFDSHNSTVTGGSWKFTAPVSGLYKVAAKLLTTDVAVSVGTVLNLNLFKNGSSFTALARGVVQTTSTIKLDVTGATLVQLNSGDYIDIRAQWSGGGPTSAQADDAQNWVSIDKVSDPAPILVTDFIGVSAYRSSSQTISNATPTVVIYDNAEDDSHGSLNTSTGVYTVPVSGRYLVMVENHWNANATGVRSFQIQLNGSPKLSAQQPGTIGGSHTVGGSVYIRCTAGQTIQVSCSQYSGGNLDLYSDSGRYTTLSIIRVGT